MFEEPFVKGNGFYTFAFSQIAAHMLINIKAACFLPSFPVPLSLPLHPQPLHPANNFCNRVQNNFDNDKWKVVHKLLQLSNL